MNNFQQEDISFSELSAEIRNHVQPAKTVLEFIRSGKQVPLHMVERSIAGLEQAVKILD